MGYRSSWMAARDASLEEMYAEYGVRDTGETTDLMDTGYYGTRRGVWAIVCADGRDYYAGLEASDAAALSAGRPAVYAYGDDGSMESAIFVFENGESTWSISYGEGAFDVDGEPPEAVMAILRASEDEQQTADYDCLYEAIHLVGAHLVGFRYDGTDPGPGDPPYSILR